jgi:hypothetical protein
MIAFAFAVVVASSVADEPPKDPTPAPDKKATTKAAAPAKSAATMHTPSKGTTTIAHMSSSKSGPTFDLSVGDCGSGGKAAKDQPAECSLYVSYHGRKEKLPWTSGTGAVYVQNEKSVAVGDDADTALAISWTPVTIAKGISGVVVTEQSSGERVKHRHDLFLDVKGSLDYALSAGPQRGENTWSTVTTLDVDGNGSDEIILVHASRPDADNEADQWDMSVWGWRADIAKVVKMPSWTPTIHAAMVGSFNNVKDARDHANNKCLREFIVVDSKSAPLLPDNTFAVVYPAATERDADLALEAAKACDDDIVGAVKVISKGLDVKEKN